MLNARLGKSPTIKGLWMTTLQVICTLKGVHYRGKRLKISQLDRLKSVFGLA